MALVLLATPAALAQLPEADADAGSAHAGPGAPARPCPDGAIGDGGACGFAETSPADEYVVPLPDRRALEGERAEQGAPVPAVNPRPLARRKWNLDVDTVVGSALRAPLASSLLTVRFRPTKQVGLGVVVPFVLGALPGAAALGCYGDMCAGSGNVPFGDLGNLALLATWEPVLGPATRLPVGLVIALPTAGKALIPVNYELPAAVVFEAPTRVFEDVELFLRVYGAVTPWIGVSHAVGRVDLAASARAPLLLDAAQPLYGTNGAVPDTAFLFGVVGTAQVMVGLVDQPNVRLSGGLRAVGALWGPQVTFRGEPRKVPLVAGISSVALEPRVEAHFSGGALEVRAGVLVPIAYRELLRDEVGHFPDAWGVRVGVGYSF